MSIHAPEGTVADFSQAPIAPRRVSARIGGIAESATLAVDAKAKALKAAGRPVIGFGAGEPDFPTPDYIVEAAAAACRVPANHRYTPAAGLPALRKAVAEKTLRDSGYEVTPEQVLITNGGKQAVYQTFATLLDPAASRRCRPRRPLRRSPARRPRPTRNRLVCFAIRRDNRVQRRAPW